MVYVDGTGACASSQVPVRITIIVPPVTCHIKRGIVQRPPMTPFISNIVASSHSLAHMLHPLLSPMPACEACYVIVWPAGATMACVIMLTRLYRDKFETRSILTLRTCTRGGAAGLSVCRRRRHENRQISSSGRLCVLWAQPIGRCRWGIAFCALWVACWRYQSCIFGLACLWFIGRAHFLGIIVC